MTALKVKAVDFSKMSEASSDTNQETAMCEQVFICNG